MKRIYVAILLCLFATADMLQANVFEMAYMGQTLPDSATVTVPALQDAFGFGEMWCETNASGAGQGLVLNALADNINGGIATLIIEYNYLSPTRLEWCMGGQCSLFSEETTMTKQFSFTNGVANVLFTAANCQTEGRLLATLSATVSGETHMIKILFTNENNTDLHAIEGQSPSSGDWFSLDGRRFSKPSHGLFIKDGRIVFVK